MRCESVVFPADLPPAASLDVDFLPAVSLDVDFDGDAVFCIININNN